MAYEHMAKLVASRATISDHEIQAVAEIRLIRVPTAPLRARTPELPGDASKQPPRWKEVTAP